MKMEFTKIGLIALIVSMFLFSACNDSGKKSSITSTPKGISVKVKASKF